MDVFKNMSESRRHQIWVFGHTMRTMEIGTYGFCNKCHLGFKLKDVMHETRSYKVTEGRKHIYEGKCVHCGQVWQVVDLELNGDEYRRRIDKAASVKMEAAKKLDRKMKTESAQGWRKTKANGRIYSREQLREIVLKRIRGLRAYYRNQVRNAFASEVNELAEGLDEQRYFEGERTYYEGVIKVCIREILTTGINTIWWMSLEDVDEFLRKSVVNLESAVESTRRMIKMIKEYERLNYEKYFGELNTTRRALGQDVKLNIEYPLVDMDKWVSDNLDRIKRVRQTGMPAEDDQDELWDECEDDYGQNGTKDDDNLLGTCGINKFDSKSSDGTVNAWEYDREKHGEKMDKGLDELEYGVDEIPDV